MKVGRRGAQISAVGRGNSRESQTSHAMDKVLVAKEAKNELRTDALGRTQFWANDFASPEIRSRRMQIDFFRSCSVGATVRCRRDTDERRGKGFRVGESRSSAAREARPVGAEKRGGGKRPQSELEAEDDVGKIGRDGTDDLLARMLSRDARCRSSWQR